jgi:anti-anti-sigma regulatory factor
MRSDRGEGVQQPSNAPEARFVIRGFRRNGIDRLFLIGDLDRDSVLMLEAELNAVRRTGGALILDLAELSSIDRWGLHTLERAARPVDTGARSPSIVNCHGPVRATFEEAGLTSILSDTDLTDLLEVAGGAWSPVSLPPLLGRRGSGRSRMAEERT